MNFELTDSAFKTFFHHDLSRKIKKMHQSKINRIFAFQNLN